MFLTACEIAQSEREFVVCDHSKIRLNAGLQKDACFRISSSEHPIHCVVGEEMFDDLLRLLRRDQQVEIADRFPAPSEASTGADLRYVWMLSKMLQQFIGPDLCIRQ